MLRYLTAPDDQGKRRVLCDCGYERLTHWPIERIHHHCVPPPKPRGPCQHIRAELRRIECPTCCGSVKVKAFACTIHAECTLSKPLDGIACCEGPNPCQDFVAAPRAESAAIMPT